MHKHGQGKAVLAYTDFCHFNAYLFRGTVPLSRLGSRRAGL